VRSAPKYPQKILTVGTLVMHTYLENEIYVPQVRKLLSEVEDDVLESYEEHHVADVLCMELWSMDPSDEHFDAKATVLIQKCGAPHPGGRGRVVPHGP
jgi:hypothetical protein